MNLDFQKFKVLRFDLSEDKSLKAFSAADEILLKQLEINNMESSSIAIYNDRFGFLSCHLNDFYPLVVYTNKSQINAIELNLESNNLSAVKFHSPTSSLQKKIDFAVLKIPKSLALFELFLQHIINNSTSKIQVEASFMTRHFSPKIIEICNKYFEKVEQSKAVKKARAIHLSEPKKITTSKLIDNIKYNNKNYKQYWGVFSAKHIDYATQYFLENIEVKETDCTILDLASGNGVIAKEIYNKHQQSTYHLLDDSILAVESAKLNLNGDAIHHHFNNNLNAFQDSTFDLIVSNPPFHFEHEINIQIPIKLFKECYRCLKKGGNFQLVANNHLNYSTHLNTIFSKVTVVSQNDNFTILKCTK